MHNLRAKNQWARTAIICCLQWTMKVVGNVTCITTLRLSQKLGHSLTQKQIARTNLITIFHFVVMREREKAT